MFMTITFIFFNKKSSILIKFIFINFLINYVATDFLNLLILYLFSTEIV